MVNAIKSGIKIKEVETQQPMWPTGIDELMMESCFSGMMFTVVRFVWDWGQDQQSVDISKLIALSEILYAVLRQKRLHNTETVPESASQVSLYCMFAYMLSQVSKTCTIAEKVMVAHKCQPSSKGPAHRTNTTAKPHYISYKCVTTLQSEM